MTKESVESARGHALKCPQAMDNSLHDAIEQTDLPALIEPGDAVHNALSRAVADNRIVDFTHPLSQAGLSREAAMAYVQAALETPTRPKITSAS